MILKLLAAHPPPSGSSGLCAETPHLCHKDGHKLVNGLRAGAMQHSQVVSQRDSSLLESLVGVAGLGQPGSKVVWGSCTARCRSPHSQMSLQSQTNDTNRETGCN